MQKEKLLVGFFESYLKLNEEEEATFMEEARKLDNAEDVLEITVSYEEKGREKGKKQVALALLRKGLDRKLFIETTGLSMEEIKDLEKQL